MARWNGPYRVIQWATGAVGKYAIAALHHNPAFELVGCWVHSPDKVGKDAGEIAGIEPIGVKATQSIEEILELEADAVHYAPLLSDPGELCRILESGSARGSRRPAGADGSRCTAPASIRGSRATACRSCFRRSRGASTRSRCTRSSTCRT
jgi:hypothetical protein